MPFTHEDWLPSFEELNVPEITMTAAPLKASAHHFGKYCDQQSKEFMLCSQEEKDPRKCLNEGKQVTRCAVEFFNRLRQECADEFTKYWECIDHSGFDMDFKKCRKTQGIYDKCVFDKLGQERPPAGYFSKVRIHESRRPKPVRELPLPEPMPDPPEITEEAAGEARARLKAAGMI